MKVDKVERGKKKVTILVEGEEYALHPIIWADHAVFEGEEIDLENVLALSEREWALEAGLSYATRFLRTRAQVAEYLRRKELDPTQEVLDKLEEWGAINDREFARSYAQSLAHKNGPYHIRAKLQEKGISSEIIRELVLEEDPAVLKDILQKKYRDWEDISLQEAMKRQNFLVRRGFSFESARKAVDSMKK
ncbi:MAG TPA: regulatory protein RecX [Tissierellia bacterium]|nr:regulatory protein RecX [Tissierellia bacterium]